MTLDDILLNSQGKEEKITSLENTVRKTEVFNLETKLNHNYFAEGLLVHNKLVPKVITKVEGLNPNTGERPISNLYDKVSATNIQEVFQNNLESKFGQGIYGGKAVAYIDYEGNYHIAFLTETESTHHRHALAELAKSVHPGDVEITRAANAFYDGNWRDAGRLLSNSFGFEFQFDSKTGKIIGIQQDSWIKKTQEKTGKKFNKGRLEETVLNLIINIDPTLLSDPYKDLNWVDNPELYKKLVPPELVAAP